MPVPPYKSRHLLLLNRGHDRGQQGIISAYITGQPASVTAAAWYGSVTGDEHTYGVTAQVTVGTEAIPGWVILIPGREVYWRAELEREQPSWLPDTWEE